MKKFFSYLILGLSIFFLAACGGDRVDFVIAGSINLIP